MGSDAIVTHDDGTPTGSRSTSFFIRGIPWAGCLVHIHEVVEKAGREVFRCSLSGRASGRWLEIPAWMFDRAARAAWRVGAAPYVEIAVLTALATLLQDVTSVSGAPLFIGEKVGINAGPRVDIAVDPLEGTTLCAKNMPGAIATMAMADGGTLLHAPDVYMQKIAIGPGYKKGVVELDAPPADNVRRLAKAKGVDASAITVLGLDRPRHGHIIAGVRSTGAAVRLITDGDVAGVIP